MKSTLYKIKRQFQKFLQHSDTLKSLIQLTESNNFDQMELIHAIKQYPDFAPAQKDQEMFSLMDIAKKTNIKTICEIGSYKGGSLFLLAQMASKNASIISIDIDYPLEKRFLFGKFARKSQKIKCIRGNTQNPKTVESVRRALSGRKIDLLFIDGDHSFFGVMNDFVRFSPLMSEKGIIAFHDIHPDFRMHYGVNSSSFVGGVPIFWEAIKKSGLTTTEIIEDQEQDGYGLGFIYT